MPYSGNSEKISWEKSLYHNLFRIPSQKDLLSLERNTSLSGIPKPQNICAFPQVFFYLRVFTCVLD